ncbi:ABC transporter G family member 29 [Forsythia ovata]|uniref:ABC transporter G family member 29 n=1 Tax=Forsythia ovata TaxID=205694 RepID=A0ABD1XBL3_9LAMI
MTQVDVLAGSKTEGYIEGYIRISGFPKNQENFAKISGYCEQNNIRSPQVTVKEFIICYALFHRPKETFVKEVMELVELDTIQNAIIGLPGISGLSTEQKVVDNNN